MKRHSNLYSSILWISSFFSLSLSFTIQSYAAETSKLRAEKQTPSFRNTLDDITLLGHNLTPTTYVLKKGQITLGSYAVGYGVTDFWTIATSPWFDVGYNMPMINSRFLLFSREGLQVGTDVSYFKTFHFGTDRYSQESSFLRITASQKFSRTYTIHISLGYQYFWDDQYAYSIRTYPGNGDAYTTSLSSLQEIRFNSRDGMFFETGLLGLNYVTVNLHAGISVFHAWNGGLLQLGFSRTNSMGAVKYNKYYSQDLVIFHPEVQLQTYF